MEAATHFNSESEKMVVLSCGKGLPFLVFEKHALVVSIAWGEGRFFAPIVDGHIVGADINNMGLASGFNVEDDIRALVAIATGHETRQFIVTDDVGSLGNAGQYTGDWIVP